MIAFYIFLGAIFIIAVAWGLIARGNGEDAWKQLAAEIGGEYRKGSFLRSSKVQVHVRTWIVTLDSYSISSGDSSTTYTRIRAPFQNTAGLQLRITRKSLTSKLDKALGAKEIPIGDPDIDRDFVVKGNNYSKIQALFTNRRICQLIQAQRSITLMVKDNELNFETQGVIEDVVRLKSLFELFNELLTQLEG